jgi:hypothetical protein
MVLVAALGAAACDGNGKTVDADGDGVEARSDCNDSDAAVHATVEGYFDADGDGTGAGTAHSFCIGGSVPAGYAAAGTDCAPEDPARWRDVVDPPADRDGDGYTAHETATLCAGAVLPAPYLVGGRGVDCDDSDASMYRWVTLYRDEDGDGIGVRPRTSPWACFGASLPAGFSAVGWDVDDSDPAVTEDVAAEGVLGLLLD